jgi:hypothetical protein
MTVNRVAGTDVEPAAPTVPVAARLRSHVDARSTRAFLFATPGKKQIRMKANRAAG